MNNRYALQPLTIASGFALPGKYPAAAHGTYTGHLYVVVSVHICLRANLTNACVPMRRNRVQKQSAIQATRVHLQFGQLQGTGFQTRRMFIFRLLFTNLAQLNDVHEGISRTLGWTNYIYNPDRGVHQKNVRTFWKIFTILPFPEKFLDFHPPKFLMTFFYFFLFSHRPQIFNFHPIFPVSIHFPPVSRKLFFPPYI